MIKWSDIIKMSNKKVSGGITLNWCWSLRLPSFSPVAMRSAEIKYLWTFIFPFASLSILSHRIAVSCGLPLCSLLCQCGLETVDGSVFFFLWLVSKHVPRHCVGMWKINMFAWDSKLSLSLSVCKLEEVRGTEELLDEVGSKTLWGLNRNQTSLMCH